MADIEDNPTYKKLAQNIEVSLLLKKLTKNEEIAILLKEYDTLRAEVLGLNNNKNQLFTIVLGAIALGGAHPINEGFLIYFGAMVIGVTIFSVLLWNDVRHITARIRVIESEINQRADRELLQWETRSGAASGGFLGWAKSRGPQESAPAPRRVRLRSI